MLKQSRGQKRKFLFPRMTENSSLNCKAGHRLCKHSETAISQGSECNLCESRPMSSPGESMLHFKHIFIIIIMIITHASICIPTGPVIRPLHIFLSPDGNENVTSPGESMLHSKSIIAHPSVLVLVRRQHRALDPERKKRIDNYRNPMRYRIRPSLKIKQNRNW